MTQLTMLWMDLRLLLVDATRTWWRLLPRILTIYLLGWLGYQIALKLAVAVGDWNAWVALAVFAMAFVARLISIVLILRLAGKELGVRSLIPEEEYEDDGRESSLTRLLALTLFPFLGIYTAFGWVDKATNQMLIESLFRHGGGLTLTKGDVLAKVWVGSDASAGRYVVVLSVIAGAYVLRRATDLLHERSEWRPLGILVALMEAFFVLVALIGGAGIVVQVKGWIADRQVWAWVSALGHRIAEMVGSLPFGIPQIVGAVGHFLTHQVWPVFTSGITEPIGWLAIAALVYGSNVISVAELWRKGKPLASRIRLASRVIERQRAKEQQEIGSVDERQDDTQPNERGRSPHPMRQRVVIEIKEAFFNDIDDKYLPTLHSIRLILRGGLIFLGAFVVLYGFERIAAKLFDWAVQVATGGHAMSFWIVWLPAHDLITTLPFEPWRICLLAAALKRCLSIFRTRAEAQGTLYPTAGEPRTPSQVAAAGLPDGGPSITPSQQVGA